MELSLITKLEQALDKRNSMICREKNGVLRLFNGYIEGIPSLTVDIYNETLVIKEGKHNAQTSDSFVDQIMQFYLSSLPNIQCGVNKKRYASTQALRCGRVIHGGEPSAFVQENGVKYAVDLLFQQDDSFFIDNRNLRFWLKKNAKEWGIFNTFAYTGSLGIAALAGGATQVFQTDRNAAYLNLAKKSMLIK